MNIFKKFYLFILIFFGISSIHEIPNAPLLSKTTKKRNKNKKYKRFQNRRRQNRKHRQRYKKYRKNRQKKKPAGFQNIPVTIPQGNTVGIPKISSALEKNNEIPLDSFPQDANKSSFIFQPGAKLPRENISRAGIFLITQKNSKDYLVFGKSVWPQYTLMPFGGSIEAIKFTHRNPTEKEIRETAIKETKEETSGFFNITEQDLDKSYGVQTPDKRMYIVRNNAIDVENLRKTVKDTYREAKVEFSYRENSDIVLIPMDFFIDEFVKYPHKHPWGKKDMDILVEDYFHRNKIIKDSIDWGYLEALYYVVEEYRKNKNKFQ